MLKRKGAILNLPQNVVLGLVLVLFFAAVLLVLYYNLEGKLISNIDINMFEAIG